MESIWGVVKRIPVWTGYVILPAVVFFSYPLVRDIMISQEGTFWAVISGVTLNIILLYFIWGVLSDKLTKGKSKRYSWTVFFIGIFVLTLIFRFVGGLETILG